MSRFSEIAQIYDHRLPLLRSPEIWEQTLRMTSSFWRLNFCEAMLLTLQNPKAEMCGTIGQWNNIGRYIRRGEHSTAVFRSRTDTQLMYLFDVRQTYGKAYNSKWKLSERMADGIVGKFNSENAENAVSFEDYLQKSLDKNIDIIYNYNSKLNNAISNDPRTAAFIRASAEFICTTRCGIPGDRDFSDVAIIVRNISIDMIRSKKRRSTISIDNETVVVPSIDNIAEQMDYTQLLEMLRALPPIHREVLLLCARGHKTNEIAELLGISYKAASQRINRARTLFRKQIMEDNNEQHE